VPLEGGEISRPRAATCVLDIHDRHHVVRGGRHRCWPQVLEEAAGLLQQATCLLTLVPDPRKFRAKSAHTADRWRCGGAVNAAGRPALWAILAPFSTVSGQDHADPPFIGVAWVLTLPGAARSWSGPV
jgi:hypothetical protein